MIFNNIIDYHVHTEYSFDCQISMDNYCKRAIDLGLRDICFVDHLDIDYERKAKGEARKREVSKKTKYIKTENSSRIITFDIDERQKEIECLRNKYPQLKICSGIEVGLVAEYLDYLQYIINKHNFDYIIASQHLVKQRDPYCGHFFDNRSKKEAYSEYLIEIFKNINEYNNYCCVGHLGYPSRFLEEKNKIIEYIEHAEIIDEILKLLVNQGRGIEVNTVGIRITGDNLPSYSIIRRFRELHGEIITVGSDCHSIERLGENVQYAMQIVKNAGFDYITCFTNMTPKFIKI